MEGVSEKNTEDGVHLKGKGIVIPHSINHDYMYLMIINDFHTMEYEQCNFIFATSWLVGEALKVLGMIPLEERRRDTIWGGVNYDNMTQISVLMYLIWKE